MGFAIERGTWHEQWPTVRADIGASGIRPVVVGVEGVHFAIAGDRPEGERVSRDPLDVERVAFDDVVVFRNPERVIELVQLLCRTAGDECVDAGIAQRLHSGDRWGRESALRRRVVTGRVRAVVGVVDRQVGVARHPPQVDAPGAHVPLAEVRTLGRAIAHALVVPGEPEVGELGRKGLAHRHVDARARQVLAPLCGAQLLLEAELVENRPGRVDIDHAAGCIAAGEHALRPFQDLDALELRGRIVEPDELRPVHAIDVHCDRVRGADECRVRRDAAERREEEVAAARIGGEVDTRHGGIVDVTEADDPTPLERQRTERHHGDRHVLQVFAALLGGDDDLLQTAGFRRSRLLRSRRR